METDEVWVTRDGRRIAVGDMSEEHAKNTLRLLIRQRREIKEAAYGNPLPWEHDIDYD
jgi:hypothetical protein